MCVWLCFCSSRRRHTRCALVTGVQTCALPISMLAPRDRLLRVIGPSPKDPAILVEVVMDEAPLRHAMFDYSWRILNLSLGISIFTAALVYLSLHLLMVRPVRRSTESLAAFPCNPGFAAAKDHESAVQEQIRSVRVIPDGRSI